MDEVLILPAFTIRSWGRAIGTDYPEAGWSLLPVWEGSLMPNGERKVRLPLGY